MHNEICKFIFMWDLQYLRVGTLLEYNGEWAYLQENSNNGDCYIYMINKQKDELVKADLKGDLLKPLNLTRTIVQKLGFKKINPHYDKYLRTSILVEFTFEGVYKVYHVNGQILKYICDIIHAHELQDIFIQLTNEEAKYLCRSNIY